MKLENKVSVVTGGAMGNGLGIVKVFLKHGAKVIILDYSDKIDEVVADFKEKGEPVEGYRVDIRAVSYTHLDVYKRQEDR